MKRATVQEKAKEAYPKLKERFGYANAMEAPRLEKVVVSVGIGSGMKKDRKRDELVMDRLGKITGQKALVGKAKKAIATWKTREGEPLGLSVTLRGKRMYLFLEKFLNVSLPRTKDFKGVDRSVVDDMGNMTIGVKEHSIFPETAEEDLKDVFGLGITVVTTAKSKEEATAFFELLGVPFKK